MKNPLSREQEALRGRRVEDMTDAQLELWLHACDRMEPWVAFAKARRTWKAGRLESGISHPTLRPPSLIMSAEIIVLRLVHILGGIFWLGSGLFTTFFLIPALGRVGPSSAGPVMGALQERRLFTILPVIALLTIISGVRLFQIVSGGFAPAYVASRTGQTFLWSGVAAVAAFILSLAVARPAAVQTGQLAATMASLPEDQRAARGAEIERLRRRGGLASVIAMVLLIGAATGMAVARYLA